MKLQKFTLVCAALLMLSALTSCAKYESDEEYNKAKQAAGINTSFDLFDCPTYEGTNIKHYSMYDQLTKVENFMIVETYYDTWLDPAGDELNKRHEEIIAAAKDLGYILEDIKLENVEIGVTDYKKATYKFKKK